MRSFKWRKANAIKKDLNVEREEITWWKKIIIYGLGQKLRKWNGIRRDSGKAEGGKTKKNSKNASEERPFPCGCP